MVASDEEEEEELDQEEHGQESSLFDEEEDEEEEEDDIFDENGPFAEAICDEEDSFKNSTDEDSFSEEEPLDDTENDRLSWRMDPEESHSDWTIEIKSSSTSCGKKKSATTTTKKYHVHKNILAVGSKKAEYFVRLFARSRDGFFSESKRQTSRIEFDELAAKAFPDMLDYLYSDHDELRIDTENATALCFLGRYFEAKRLTWKAYSFWKDDMGTDNFVTYYEHAEVFRDDKVVKAVVKTICEDIFAVEPDSEIMDISSASFWIDVLKHQEWGSFGANNAVKHLSMLIAAFCDRNQDDLDAETFLALTNQDDMPSIHYEVAEKFMELERSISSSGSSSSTCHSSSITSLQHRCVDALAEQWETLDVSSKKALAFLSSNYSPAVLSHLLAQSLLFARRDKRAAVKSAKRKAKADAERKNKKKKVCFLLDDD